MRLVVGRRRVAGEEEIQESLSRPEAEPGMASGTHKQWILSLQTESEKENKIQRRIM